MNSLNEFALDENDASSIAKNIHIHNNIDFGNWGHPENRNRFSNILKEELDKDLYRTEQTTVF